MEQTEKAKTTKKKMMVIGASVAVATVGGYFGWQYWQKRRQSAADTSPANPASPPKAASAQKKLPAASKPAAKLSKPAGAKKTSIPAQGDNFPLKKGSSGPHVKTLQQALIAKYGKSILPRYGADGGFGTEMVTALAKLKLPAQVNESTYNVLVKGSAPDPSKLAQTLYKAAESKDQKAALTALKTMRGKEDYTKVNNIFKTKYRIGGGVRQNLVGMINSFPSEAQKQSLRMEFNRMGLNYDGDKWSLSGTDGPSIITTKATRVGKDQNHYVEVPKGMVLGRFIKKAGPLIRFENQGRHFFVRADAVQRLL